MTEENVIIDFHCNILIMDDEIGQDALLNPYNGGVERSDQKGFKFVNFEIVLGKRIAVIEASDYQDVCEAGLFLFDVTDQDSFFDELPSHFQALEDNNESSEFDGLKIVIGRKPDVQAKRVVSRKQGEEFARSINALYFETTDTDIDSIRAVMHEIVRAVVGATAMHEAAVSGNVAAIEEAFASLGQQSLDATDWQGSTPMHYAAEQGHTGVIEALVRLGSQAVDTPDYEGFTPVYAAARKGHVSAIETLVRLGSTAINTPDSYGRTPMHAAADNGHGSVVEALVRLGSQAIDTPNKDGIH